VSVTRFSFISFFLGNFFIFPVSLIERSFSASFSPPLFLPARFSSYPFGFRHSLSHYKATIFFRRSRYRIRAFWKPGVKSAPHGPWLMGKAHSWLPSTKKLFVNPSVFLLYLVFYDGPGPEPEPLSFFSCPSIFSLSPSVRILRRLIRRHLVLSCFPSFTVIIGSVNYGNLLTLFTHS
jgi:hypothetical protein